MLMKIGRRLLQRRFLRPGFYSRAGLGMSQLNIKADKGSEARDGRIQSEMAPAALIQCEYSRWLGVCVCVCVD